MHSPAVKGSGLYLDLLRQAAQKEIRRINRSSDELQLKRVIQRAAANQETFFSTAQKPLIEWTSANDRDFDRWLHAPVPNPVRWEEASCHKMWTPGDPIVLNTDGRDHVGWIKIDGWSVTPYWLGFDPDTLRIDLEHVTLRDPRKHWAHAWLLQCANALVTGDSGNGCYRWMVPELSTTDPQELELLQVLFEARMDLVKG